MKYASSAVARMRRSLFIDATYPRWRVAVFGGAWARNGAATLSADTAVTRILRGGLIGDRRRTTPFWNCAVNYDCRRELQLQLKNYRPAAVSGPADGYALALW